MPARRPLSRLHVPGRGELPDVEVPATAVRQLPPDQPADAALAQLSPGLERILAHELREALARLPGRLADPLVRRGPNGEIRQIAFSVVLHEIETPP